jgi:hypothetical protein
MEGMNPLPSGAKVETKREDAALKGRRYETLRQSGEHDLRYNSFHLLTEGKRRKLTR